MTHIFRVFLACLITISLFISSCVREDDEPIVPENSITRLYISYSDYQSNEDLDPYENVVIIDPADREDLFSVNLKHTSEARGGAALHFSPFAKRLLDRKSTRLNSSHVSISYAVFCLKKKITEISV